MWNSKILSHVISLRFWCIYKPLLISISANVLEYDALRINYAASYHYWHTHPNLSDLYPLLLLYGDNRALESWMEKVFNSSLEAVC